MFLVDHSGRRRKSLLEKPGRLEHKQGAVLDSANGLKSPDNRSSEMSAQDGCGCHPVFLPVRFVGDPGFVIMHSGKRSHGFCKPEGKNSGHVSRLPNEIEP
jgi:hypothetical protein